MTPTPNHLAPDRLATDADVERSVVDRYGAGAQAVEAALCCPVDYDRGPGCLRSAAESH